MRAPDPVNVKTLLQEAEAILADHDTPRLDAEVLLSFVMGYERGRLYAWPENEVVANQAMSFRDLVKKRNAGWPVAYLTGSREFWSLNLSVNEHTLVPRPETECAVEVALARLPGREPYEVLDLGTGSGAIALAIASERPNASVVAVDISAQALQQARQNREALGINNVSFKRSCWLDDIDDRSFDLVISNPPYVESSNPLLDSTDISFEPRLALDGGQDGLDAYRKIIPAAFTALKTGGHLVLEHGFEQASAVASLLIESGFNSPGCRKDYAGLERVSYARKG